MTERSRKDRPEQPLDAYPAITFALGMATSNGSPEYPVIAFDDGATIALHELRGLAAKCGVSFNTESVTGLVNDWGRSFPALAQTASVLAYGDDGRGYRGQLVPDEILTFGMLLRQARQIFRVNEHRRCVLPVSVQSSAAAGLLLDPKMQGARPNLCLGAVMGALCKDVDANHARAAIAGWTLVIEIALPEESDPLKRWLPGSVFAGPVMVPGQFAQDLSGIEYVFAVMGRPLVSGDLGSVCRGAERSIAALSSDSLLMPGDLIILGPDPNPDFPAIGKIDVVSSYASGFGSQQVSLL